MYCSLPLCLLPCWSKCQRSTLLGNQRPIFTNLWETFSHWTVWLTIIALLGEDYIQYTALLPLKMIYVNWKGSDQTFNGGEWGSNWEGKKQDCTPRLPNPCSYSLYSAHSLSVHHSLKIYSLHHWTMNLCCTNCYNTADNTVKFFQAISLCCSLITTWLLKPSVAQHCTTFAWPTACKSIQDWFWLRRRTFELSTIFWLSAQLWHLGVESLFQN